MEKQKIRDLVEDMLKREPKTRNDDNWLWFRLMVDLCKVKGKTMFIPFELLSELKQSSVFRCRQVIQNEDGLYLPTDAKVRKDRRVSAEKWRNWLNWQK